MMRTDAALAHDGAGAVASGPEDLGGQVPAHVRERDELEVTTPMVETTSTRALDSGKDSACDISS